MRKKKINEVIELKFKKLPANIANPLSELRDSMINYGNIKPFEASFLASMIGELIRYGILEANTGKVGYPLDTITVHKGFRSVISRIMTTNQWNSDLSKISIKMTHPNPDGRQAPLEGEDTRTPIERIREMDETFNFNGYEVLKDFIERTVLANSHFTKLFEYEVLNDGIVVLTKKELEEVEEDINKDPEKEFKDSLIPLENLSEHARNKLEYLQNTYAKTKGYVVAYDENWATIGFNAVNRDNQKGLDSFYKRAFPTEYENSGFRNRHSNMVNTDWCTFNSQYGGANSTYNRNNESGTITFLTISLRPLDDLFADANSYKYDRNELAMEVYMYNPIPNTSGKILNSVHPAGNSPHHGEDYSTHGSYLKPKMTYRYEDIPFRGVSQNSIDKYKSDGDFIINEENTLIGYSGSKQGIEELIIPGHVRVIDRDAIKDFRNLKRLVIPPSVTILKERAINNCMSLRFIQVSDRLKIVENKALYSLGNVYFGVFERKDGKIFVRPPKNLEYMDKHYLEYSLLRNSKLTKFHNISTSPIESFSSSQLYVDNTLNNDPNRLSSYSTDDIVINSGGLTHINLKNFEKEFNVPTGLVRLDRIRETFDRSPSSAISGKSRVLDSWFTEKTILNRLGYNEETNGIYLPFYTEELIINPTYVYNPSLRVEFESSYTLKRISLNSMDLYTKRLGTAPEMYIHINAVNRFKTDWAKNLTIKLSERMGGVGMIVTNDPRSLHYALKANRKNMNNLRIMKGTSLDNIEGEMDKDKLGENKEVFIETKSNKSELLKNLILESTYTSVDVTSYTQLIRQLKQLSTIDKDQLKHILDKVEFIPDKVKDYRNIELDTEFILLPVVINSDIKVKIVKIESDDGIILILPNNIVDSYETINNTPEELDNVNKSLILYAEVVGFDTEDPELHEIIKKAYLSAGDSIGAFTTHIVEEEPEETEELDEFGSLPDLGNLSADEDFEPFDDFSIDELDANFESFKKFKVRTNSLNKLVNSIKKDSPEIIAENVRLAKISNTLVVEVDNKNIYRLLEATPNLGKTILKNFGEFLKNQKNTQLIESYNANGKRYFVIAEQASNNFWLTEQDKLQDVDKKVRHVVPKKDNIIILKNSNIRLAERKIVPKKDKDNIVFIKGGK